MNEGRKIGAIPLLLLYAIAAFLLFAAYWLFFPGTKEPLSIFRLKWRFSGALIQYIAFFPAVALSAIAAHFAFGQRGSDEGARFSSEFLKAMTPSVIAVILAAILYSALFLLALPAALDARTRMASEASLFKSSAEKASAAVDQEDWLEAGRYMTISDRIWPNSPVTEEDRKDIKIGMESLPSTDIDSFLPLAIPESPDSPLAALLPGVSRSTTAPEAVEMARAAYRQKRFYDAHWLALFAERIARPQSPEYAAAARVASDAWNDISALEPSSEEKDEFALYRRKQAGYSAVVAGDWIRGYYIFSDLMNRLGDDPDVRRYFDLSSKGARSVAFFVDEVGANIGTADTDVFLSLPETGGTRAAVHIEKLHLFSDAAYGEGFELIEFDPAGIERFRVKAPFAKMSPFNDSAAGVPIASRTAVLMLALDKKSEKNRRGPVWTPADPKRGTSLLLDASFDDVALAVRARHGVASLSVSDLLKADERLGTFGFIPESFRVETMRRLVEPFSFFSLAVFILAIAWRFRSSRGSGLFGVAMLAVLPLAMDIVVQGYRVISVTTSAMFCVLLPFGAAMTAVLAVQFLLLLGAFVFLAGQRG